VPEPLAVGAVGEPVHVQGASREVRQDRRRDPGGVGDELPFGDRPLPLAGRKQHLVEVRHLQRATVDVPGAAVAEVVEGGELVVGQLWGPYRDGGAGSRQVRAPQPIGVLFDLLVRTPGEHRAWMVLRIPVGDGIVVVLVQQQPLLLVAAAVAAAADQHQAAAELGAVHVRMQLAARHRRGRVVGLVGLPGADVPDDDVAAAVLTGRDHALEVEILDRVVLDVDGHPAGLGIERRALRHRPADQDPVDLEPQVVVQPAGAMSLHDEPRLVSRGRSRAPRGFGRTREVPLAVVLGQLVAGAGFAIGVSAPGLGHRHPLPRRVVARSLPIQLWFIDVCQRPGTLDRCSIAIRS
jgi:hypothetical protein